MNVQTNPYPELAKVLSADEPAAVTRTADPSEIGSSAIPRIDAEPASASLSDTATAVAQVIQLIDQQIALIETADMTFSGLVQGQATFAPALAGVRVGVEIPDGSVPFTTAVSFPGAPAMLQALADMQNAAAGWAPTKAAIIAAGRALVDVAPQAAALGQTESDPAQIAAAVTAFAGGPLQTVVAGYSNATPALQNFQSAMASVESRASNANDQAKDALNAMQVQVQAEIDGVQAQLDNLRSAGSIILGILSGGISIAVQLKNLTDAISSLQSDEQSAQIQQQAYAMAYSQFTNALSATDLGVRAMATLNTRLEQTLNGLNDIQTNTSMNAAVMEAELSSFCKEFAAVVETSKSIAS